jgi:predicted GNAT family N-acyltransferase
MITVKEVELNSDAYRFCLDIRREVFVIGQNVPEEDEVDEFEGQSHHFLAWIDDTPAGAARWRKNDDYVKLERFAVLEKYRGKGIGSALVEKVLDSIASKYPKGTRLLLHSQIPAIPLYAKYNFKEEGELFDECGIMHRTMTRLL